MNKKIILTSSVFIVLLWFIGCTGDKANNPDSSQGFPVKVLKIESRQENLVNGYIGIIEESVSVPVSFLTIGQVGKVHAVEGQKIKKGQLLAELDDRNYLSMYQMSLAKEKQAEDAFTRLSDLYKKGSLPEIKYIEIQTGVDQARSATQIALKNMNDCKLYAPMDGIIGKRSIEPGMSILPAVTVFKLVKIDKVYVKVSVPENEISSIKTGDKAEIRVTALDNQQFEGSIEEKGVMSNPLSHTYEIKIALRNPDEKLMPGMVCKVTIQNNTSLDRVVVPSNVIQIDKYGQKYVYVVDINTNKSKIKYVKVGSPYRNGVIITTGLLVGDQLIVEGYQKVSEDATIQIVK